MPVPISVETVAADEAAEEVAAEETIETALAGPHEADVLGADVGMPMLLLSRQTFDTEERPVEWVRSVYRGDRYKFVATLNRP